MTKIIGFALFRAVDYVITSGPTRPVGPVRHTFPVTVKNMAFRCL